MEPGTQIGAFSVSLAVKDLTASRAFYELLGFEATAGSEDDNWLFMVNGTTMIGLFHGMFEENILTFNPGLTQDKQQVDADPHVRQIQAALIDAGHEPMLALDGDEGPGHFVVTDPDGNQLMFDQFS